MCHICLQDAEAEWQRYEASQPGGVPIDTGKPVWSTAQIIDQLRTGVYVFGDTIEYAIPTVSNFFIGGESTGFSPLNAFQEQQAHLVYELWDDLIAPSIVESPDAYSSDIKIANTSTNITYAHAFAPFGGGVGGTVWLSSAYANLQSPVEGQSGFRTILHEVGHTLGLEHAGNYNGNSPTYEETAEYAQDSRMYSIMSYFSAAKTGADHIAADFRQYEAQTPLLHDVMAIQAMYGADMTTRTGDTVYGYNSNIDSPIFDFTRNEHPVLTIWDAGGNDTLDLSGAWPDLFNQGSVINLAPGSFSATASMTNNISIAYGAWIENAIGARGNDTITGNKLDNRLEGNAGDDVLNGANGDDYLDGGAGRDRLIGGAGNDTLVYDPEDDPAALSGGSGTDTLLINGGSIPIFDLASRGIELARHIQTETIGGSETMKISRYNAAWQMMIEEGTNEYGERYVTVRDVDNTQSWASYTNTFDLGGNLFEQTGEHDNGQTWRHSYDVGNTGPWSRITTTTDTSNITWWETATQYVNDDGEIYLQDGRKDNGHTWQHQYDVDDTAVWSRFSFTFDAQYRNFLQSGEFDSGESWTQHFDVGEDYWWKSHSNNFTADGVRYHQMGEKDNGQTWRHFWDVADTEVWSRQTVSVDNTDLTWWSEHTLYFNDANEVYRQTGVKDDTDTWEHIWDVAGTETWHRQTRLQDVQDVRDWSEQIQTFDAAGNLLSTSYVDDIA